MDPKAWLTWGIVACIALAAFNTLANDDIGVGDKAIAFFAASLALSFAWTLLVLLGWGVRSVRDRAERSRPRH